MNVMPAFVYCADPETVNWALPYLEMSPYIIVDCEGRNIGQLGGVLSLICIGSAAAQDVFIVDMLALQESGADLQRLRNVLQNPATKKVMWDCRNDFLEIQEVLGVSMNGILDLQLAEISSRREEHYKRVARIAAGGKRVPFKFVKDNRALFNDVHALKGMEQTLRDSKLEIQGKDPDVVAMHKADGSTMWLQRPLHPKLLAYAANDIYMMNALYIKFLQDRWITPWSEHTLVEQSMRYALALSYQGRVAAEDVFGSCGILPLDVLREPRGLTVPCVGCRRIQGLDCFTLQKHGQRVRLRSSLCRVCQIKTVIKKDDSSKLMFVPVHGV